MKKSRLVILAVLFALLCSACVVRLVKLQLIDGAQYREQSFSRVVTRSSEKAARGEILDRYCRPLVRNEPSLSVNLNLKICKNVNETVSALISVFDEYGQGYEDVFPISDREPYIYSDRPETFLTFLKERKADPDGTAEEALTRLIAYYGLDDLPSEEARDVIAVRYGIYRAGTPSLYSFAVQVPIEVVSALRERSERLVGVEVSSDYARVYTAENFASHILGYLGAISPAEYEALESQGYTRNDILGKDGIEKICENYLRGTEGYRFLEINAEGVITGELPDKQPAVSGCDVILTIDSSMQSVLEDSLEQAVIADKKKNGEDAGTSASGVFMDVRTGEILALASFPDYNLATFYRDYPTLSLNADSPYVNRAVSGAFPPGSTWKLVTAIAGLEEGVITRNTVYHCTGRYTYYDSYQPTCNNAVAHGDVNVEQALQKSCNCFFYDVGRQLGSVKLAEYAARFGFGSRSGVELTGEISGTVASSAAREAAGGKWESGESLLAAIGQTDNAVTPLQLAIMAATIANDGVRLQPHIIKSITNADTGFLQETAPTVAEQLGISQTTLNTVRRGMYRVINEKGGTAYSSFLDFDSAVVCGKSGTAETPPGQAAALFVGYAPYDDPKIAFSVVIEHGGIGAYAFTTQVIKDVLSYYFSARVAFDTVLPVNQLLP